MNTPATAFLFIGIIVLAVAVIALVIWVAMLSNRIKRLSDRVIYEASAQPASRASTQIAHPSPAAIEPSGLIAPTNSMGVTEAFTPQPMQPLQVLEPMPMAESIQMQESIQVQEARQPLVQTTQQTVRSVQPAMARVRTNTVQPMEENDDGQAFFDSYRDKSEGQQTGAFGRERPSIPFGEDRNEAIKRESYYARDVIDTTDYDPDSIDFSRVAGYRNIRR